MFLIFYLLVLTQLSRTGWLNVKDKLRRILGNEIIDQTKEIWGLDDEQEINGIYKYSGYPGVSPAFTFPFSMIVTNISSKLWFAAGDFAHSRYCSKQLVR